MIFNCLLDLQNLKSKLQFFFQKKKKIAKETDLSVSFKEFLEYGIFDENSKVMKILKLLSTRAIQRSIKQLKEALYDK